MSHLQAVFPCSEALTARSPYLRSHSTHLRVESIDDRSLALVTRRLRHYLSLVVVPAHRKAITGLYLRDQNLSMERLCYPVRYRGAVPRRFMLCRLCRRAAEDQVHALFGCTSQL
ncbi:hypothetical protein C8J57DRAFT_1067306 [Mycena rebaudengoi]|nr:hypothetical protein C8J57DRAFT_1067306 [Mycena rebaudengoi]